jgi:hypothetical protein
MVIVLCVCVLAAAWALNFNRSDGEFHVCNPDSNSHDHGEAFSNKKAVDNLSSSRFTYRIIEIAPKDKSYRDYDPNYPSRQLPKRKYKEPPKIEDHYKIIPAKEHLLQMNEE